MNSIMLADHLRDMFNELVRDGYKKSPMCDVTLGPSSNPQFDGFVKGGPLGSVPLARMIEGLGFELHVIPVKKDDPATDDMVTFINNNTTRFIVDAKEKLIDYLENRQVRTRAGTGTVRKAFDEQVQELFKSIE